MRPTASAIRNLLVLAIVLVALRVFIGLPAVEQILHKAISPLSSAVEKLAFFDTTQTDEEANFLAELEDLEQQNDQLRDQLNLSQDYVTAEIISKDITGFRKSLIINQGSSAGVKVGQAVVWDNLLVGRISRVTSTTSVVQLVTDPDFKTTAKTKTGEGGVIKSDNGSLVYDLVPEANLEGSMVSTDGVDGQFAPGITIGVLGQRLTAEDKTFHTYHLLLGKSAEGLEMVMVSKAGQQ